MIHIICILDKSGSMRGLETEVIGNFNKFIKEQKKLKGKAKVTLAIFDDEYTLVYDKVPLNKVNELTTKEYNLGGMTALYDGIGKTINSLRDKKKAIVLIHTDGYENSSKEYTKEIVKDLIKSKPKWEFIFVGADIDASSIGNSIGINNTITNTRSVADIGATYASFAETTMCYRSGNEVKL